MIKKIIRGIKAIFKKEYEPSDYPIHICTTQAKTDYDLAKCQLTIDMLREYKLNEPFIPNTEIKPSELEAIGVRKSDLAQIETVGSTIPVGIKVIPFEDGMLKPRHILLIKQGAFDYTIKKSDAGVEE